MIAVLRSKPAALCLTTINITGLKVELKISLIRQLQARCTKILHVPAPKHASSRLKTATLSGPDIQPAGQ